MRKGKRSYRWSRCHCLPALQTVPEFPLTLGHHLCSPRWLIWWDLFLSIIYLSIYLSIIYHLSTYLSIIYLSPIYLSNYLIYLSIIYLSFFLFIYHLFMYLSISIYPSTYPPIYLNIAYHLYLSIHLSIIYHLFIYLIYLSICLSIFWSIYLIYLSIIYLSIYLNLNYFSRAGSHTPLTFSTNSPRMFWPTTFPCQHFSCSSAQRLGSLYRKYWYRKGSSPQVLQLQGQRKPTSSPPTIHS